MRGPIEQAADRLLHAYETGETCAPVRDLIGLNEIDTAYRVQDINTERWVANGRRIVGRKIGLTSKAVQTQLGVDQPDFGILYADMVVRTGDAIPMQSVMQAKVEAEVALILDKPLTKNHHTPEDVAKASAYACPALEIVGSRIANWDIKIVDTIADNASSGRFVLGNDKVPLEAFDLVQCKMVMTKNLVEVSSGTGAACLGNPLNAAVWLADTMVRVGRPLQEGDIVMTGALGPMAKADAGDVFQAKIDGLGSVEVSFIA